MKNIKYLHFNIQNEVGEMTNNERYTKVNKSEVTNNKESDLLERYKQELYKKDMEIKRMRNEYY